MSVFTLAASESGTSSTVLKAASDLLSWVLDQGTAIITWALGNPYAVILLVMFIAGFAVAMLARILYSL